jgi:hydrogenase maturation protease
VNSTEPASTLVLCLGNDVLRDDGVGWRVAAALAARPAPGVVVKRTGLSGFYLLDDLINFDNAIIVDAVRTREHPPGTVLSFPLEALGTPAGPSPHAVGLPTVLTIGRRAGMALPTRVHVVAVEVEDMETFDEHLTDVVQAAVPRAVRAVEELLDQIAREPSRAEHERSR